MTKFLRGVLGVLSAIAIIISMLVLASGEGGAATFSDLTLQNGWVAGDVARPPGASITSGIVTLKGSMRHGTNPVAFTLPPAFRPGAIVDVPVGLCSAAKGRLEIAPSGVARVEDKGGALSGAKCSTSLEGASFAVSANGFTNLALQNGWANYPFGTSDAAVRKVAGIVHLKGAINTTGTNPVPFTLPPAFRPATNVHVPIDLCNATSGDLQIAPTGLVTVQAGGGAFSNAQCFTSLDGASFATSPNGFTNLTLQNGWTNAPSGTSNAAAEDIRGIVHLKGAIATTGTNTDAFTLPPAFRPGIVVGVGIALCDGSFGELTIDTPGTVQVTTGTFSKAQCRTSLDGVTFAAVPFSPIASENGWTNGPSGTSAIAGGSPSIPGFQPNVLVHLKGAIATAGSNPAPFTLPPAFRPATVVYIPVDLCNATNGRLQIDPSGAATVQAEGGAFSNAQCLTSLEGASFATSASGFTNLTLQNGWTNAPFGTSDAAVEKFAGIVHLKGAITTGGTNPVPFTLPPAFRPATNVFVPVDLCNATHGDLLIAPSGVVRVQAEGGHFSDAQCFTSLDGASFATSTKGFTNLTLHNGWINGPSGTSIAAAEDIGGIVQLKGAIAGGSTSAITTLPVRLRPAKDVFIPVDLYGSAHGDLLIKPSGAVTVQEEGGAFPIPKSFTSLDGASYVP